MPRGVTAWSAWFCGLAYAALAAFPLYNIDAYGHLAQGRQIAALGSVPRVDPFSFWKPEPQPWQNYEWGYDLLTWWAYDLAGPNALIALKCVAIGFAAFALVKLASRLAPNAPSAAPLAAAVLLIVGPFARLRFTVRPQVVGLLFPAVLLVGLHTLYRPETSPRRRVGVLVGLALMQVAWVNLHGSHLLGLLITFLFGVFAARTPALRSVLTLLGLQVLATACTPFGLGIITDAVAHVFIPAYRDVVIEWGPWSPSQPLYLLLGPAAMLLLVLVALGPVARSSRYGLAYAVFCVVVCLMAFRSIRFVAHALLFTAPFVAAGLAQRSWFRDRGRVAMVAAGAAAVWAVVAAPRIEPFVPFGLGEPRLGHAWAAADVIDEHVEAPRILAPIQDSWPLMFAVPDAQFLVDGRVPFYGPAWVRRVTNAFSDPPALEELLDHYDVNAVVVDHTRPPQLPAVGYLSAAPDWILAQVQDRQSLFLRTSASETAVPLEVVGPGFSTGRMLDPDVESTEVDREIDRVGVHQNSAAIQGWLRGLRALRPLARDGAYAGIRRYQTDGERASARLAYDELGAATETYPGFTAVELYRGLAALAACDVEAARTSLARAAYAGETRGTALASFELVLRSADDQKRREALAAIDGLLARPDAAEDPWLIAIREDFETRCP